MAWSSPRTWSTGELVTAAFMNTHVRDNLNYLKGAAGTIAFEAGATFDGNIVADAGTFGDEVAVTSSITRHITMEKSGEAVKSFFTQTTGASIWDVNREPVSGTFGDTGKSHARIQLDGNTSSSFIQFRTANAANTTGTERMRITGAGDLGLGVTSPQGRLHGYDSFSGFMHWEGSGVDGTARTVIPDGTGDVVRGLNVMYVIRAVTAAITNTGVLITGGSALEPSENGTLFNNGGNICQIQISAAGAVTVVRTGGTDTYDIALWLLWI
jgi:hypothetical protein